MPLPAAVSPLLLAPSRREALSLMLGLGSGGWAHAATPTATALEVTVTLPTQRLLHATRPQLLGSNTPWEYGGEGLVDEAGQWRPGVMARAREWAPGMLRYPGGELADTYRWRDGVGADRAPVLAYEGQPLQRMVYGTPEFLETCEALGATPLIVLNMHQGSDAELARQAADWVRHVNGQGLRSRRTGQALPKVLDWELGNEPYLKDSKRPDGQPNPLFQRPEAYARRVNTVMAAMREADPGLRLGLPFALDTYSGRPWRPQSEPATVVGEQLGYADKLLAGLQRPQDVGFLALHHYMPLISGPSDATSVLHLLPSDEALYWGAVSGSEVLRRHLQTVAEFWSQHPRTARVPLPRLRVTEYNAFFTNSRAHGKELKQNSYIHSQAGALFVADLIRVLSQDPRVDAATQWSMVGNWQFGAIVAGASGALAPVRPVFHVMRLAGRLLQAGGQHLAPEVAVARTPRAGAQVGFAAPFPDMPLASASATRRGATVQLMLLNKDPQRPATVSVLLQGDRAAAASAEQLLASQPLAASDQPGGPALVASEARLVDGGQRVQWTLGPAAVGLLTLNLR